MFHELSIGDIVIDIPKAMDYFKELKIDFCCGGNRLLSDVIKEKGLKADEVYTHLAHLKERKDKLIDTHDFTKMSKKELVEYIVEKHHRYLKKYLPIISTYMNAVMRAHGRQHPELFEVGKTYGVLSSDLLQHIIKEELIIFPALLNKEKQVEQLTQETCEEHVDVGRLLAQLREITHNYVIPNDACESYKDLYRLLEKLENDTHIHVHLENNILFQL